MPAEPGHSGFCPWPGQRCKTAARRGESTEGCPPGAPQLPASSAPSLSRSQPGAGTAPEIPVRSSWLRCRSLRGKGGRLLYCSLVPADETLKYFFPPLTRTFLGALTRCHSRPQHQEHIQTLTIYSDTSPRSSGNEELYTEDDFLIKKGTAALWNNALLDSLPIHISSSGKGIWRKRCKVLQRKILQGEF